MALVWSKTVDDTLYEVRSAGGTRRLYTNGVLHTAYNPQHPTTGSVWDLLCLPALHVDADELRSVLLLGAGAGAVVHLLNRYLKPQRIVAIDIDEVHLSVARRFFKVDYANLQLVCADAMQWVRDYRGPAFDLVIEDLFVEQDRQPVRLMHEDEGWLRQLRALTGERGLLVINHGDQREATFTRGQISNGHVYQFSQVLLQNRVLALRSRAFTAGVFEANLERHGLPANAFNFGVRNLSLQKKTRRS